MANNSRRKSDKGIKRVLLAIPTAGSDGRMRMSGIYRWLGEGHDWNTVLLHSYTDFSVRAVRKELERGLDGAIVGIPYNYETGHLLIKSQIPLVFTTSSLAEHAPANRPNTAFSLIDNFALGRAAATTFRTLGRFADYAYVHDAMQSKWSHERLAGFAAAYPGCHVFTIERESDNTVNRLNGDRIAALLTSLHHPAALLAANDIIAAQILSLCDSCGLRVPDDIAVLGIDNDTVTCTVTRPTLSSLEPAFNEAGYRAAVMLDALMRGHAIRHWARRPGFSRFVPRNSTRMLSPATTLVQNAMSIIEADALHGITPADVIGNLHVSRSLANMRFRELTGKSIGQVLTERRLAECERLLMSTNWPFHRIARAVGYENTDVLRNLFRTRHGAGPTRWRKTARTQADASYL